MRFLLLKIISVSFLAILMCSNIILLQDAGAVQENFQWTGPWVDKLQFHIILNQFGNSLQKIIIRM